MRNAILFISTIFILALLNFAIFQKQEILQEGGSILLKLAPVDPRSMMQGDYMAFRYEIENEMKDVDTASLLKHRFIVIKPDIDNVAHFVRVYNQETLAKDEKLFKFRYQQTPYPKITFKPSSFFFQEGLQPLYQKAAYAIIHYRGIKDYLLIGVADSKRAQINPPKNDETVNDQYLFFDILNIQSPSNPIWASFGNFRLNISPMDFLIFYHQMLTFRLALKQIHFQLD